MEFGIYLNQYGAEDRMYPFEDLFEQAELMETLGYDTAVVGERHFYEDGFFDPLTCMSALAARTEQLDLMTDILILPIYHPIHLAERIANIDRLSGGRTRWGVSLGYRESELVNFGVPMDQRVSFFLEILEVTKRLLEGERFDYQGDHFRFEDGFVRPQPVQEPRPRFWGGGTVEAAIRRAANHCDGLTVGICSPEKLREDIGIYRDELEQGGRESGEGSITFMADGYVADSKKQAREVLETPLLDLVFKYIQWGNPHVETRPEWEDVQQQVLYGDPDRVADMVADFEEMGVNHLIFRTQFPDMSQEQALKSIRRFGQEVIPRFD